MLSMICIRVFLSMTSSDIEGDGRLKDTGVSFESGLIALSKEKTMYLHVDRHDAFDYIRLNFDSHLIFVRSGAERSKRI